MFLLNFRKLMHENVSKELQNQENEIVKNLTFIFIPIGLLVGGLMYFQSDSIIDLEKKYKEFRNSEFSGKIIYLEHQNFGPKIEAPRGGSVFIETGEKISLNRKIYLKLEKGDFVEKLKFSDSIKFITDKEVLYSDQNALNRSKYFHKLKQNSIEKKQIENLSN